MSALLDLGSMTQDLIAWRRDFHAHPETAFDERRTADLIAERLASFGLEVHRGLGGTGVVGTLRGKGNRAIALRADMDALFIQEANGFAHRSTNDGKMHACGHDGHTTMLLGAARYLAEAGKFKGTVHFIFQPAEENEGGGRKMVEDGLFKLFPVEQVYGMHNWPGMPVGTFAVRSGPMMAAFDIFEIVVRGKGAHAAMPHTGIDPVVTAAQIVTGLQTIASRNTHPVDAAVVSVTQIHAGDTWNVIPAEVVLRGTTRSFRPEVRDNIERTIPRIARSIAEAYGATVSVRYERRYPPTINTQEATEIAARVASDVVGESQVERNPTPTMGAEDFAFMLEQKPGCYVWIGNGPSDNERVLHSPHYDFNDEVLPIGASYWARLVETTLAA